jgi:hypothetical protein
VHDAAKANTAVASGAPQHSSAQKGDGGGTAGTTDSPQSAGQTGSSGMPVQGVQNDGRARAASSSGRSAPGSPTTPARATAPGPPSRGSAGSTQASPTHSSHLSAHQHHGHEIKRQRSPVPEFPPLPDAPPPKVFGMGYSANRRVPKAQDYAGIKEEHEKQADEYDRILQEREEAMRANGELGSSGSVSPVSAEAEAVDGTVADGAESAEKSNASMGANEKARLMEQMNANQEKPTERFKKRGKGERRVRDPITGKAIIVKDADPKGE